MDEYISADPVRFDHHNLFRVLQGQTLEYRLVDPYCSLVSLILLMGQSYSVKSKEFLKVWSLVYASDLTTASLPCHSGGPHSVSHEGEFLRVCLPSVQ